MKTRIGVAWFTSQSTIGIVLKEDEFSKKAYIKDVAGHNEESDIQTVMDYGAKFPLEEAEAIINKHGSWK